MWHEPEQHVLGARTRTALLISAAALVVVVCLSIGFAVWANRGPEVTAPPTGPTPTAAPRPALSEASMMTDADAELMDEEAGWKVSSDAESIAEDAPQATCIVRDEPGLPTPEQSRLRTLTTATKEKTAALHVADLYPTTDDAKRVYQARLAQLGGCAKQPVYLQSGWTPTDLGNQSGGVVAVIQDEVDTAHSVLLVRSGRMVNVIDVAREGSALPFDGVVEAAAEVVNSQCGRTAGQCATDAESRPGVPPMGTEQPGFLTGVDIPRITPGAGEWGGTPMQSEFELSTSLCEGFDPSTVTGAEVRNKVTYLLTNDPGAPPAFGFDEVVLTMPDAKAADELLKRYDKAVAGCPKALRTAKVSKASPVKGEAGEAEITGNAYTVTQSAGSETVVYRIAMATVEEKLVYLVLPKVEGSDADFDDEQWTAVAVRAAERATQG